MFSKSTEYALRAVVYLAKNSCDNKRTGIKNIAENLGFPEPYLAKVLQHLVRKKIIYSAKGPNGGFYTTEQTLDISLLEIIEANEGLDFFNKCGLGLLECSDEKPCPIHSEYGKFRDGLFNVLAEKKIKDIVEDLDSGISFMDFGEN